MRMAQRLSKRVAQCILLDAKIQRNGMCESGSLSFQSLDNILFLRVATSTSMPKGEYLLSPVGCSMKLLMLPSIHTFICGALYLFAAAAPHCVAQDGSHSGLSPCEIILIPHLGDEQIDRDISALQKRISADPANTNALRFLAWAFVSKARSAADPGYYKLAEQSALCLEKAEPGNHEALLIRGHVYNSMHRFQEAEAIARQLTTEREVAFDFGLLGDALMEQGELEAATKAYQRMIDLKPNLQSMSRGAYIRWIKGDLEGALGIMRSAVTSGSPRELESVAWGYTRLAVYELQAGNFATAKDSIRIALQFHENYPPALLVQGRLQLAENDAELAAETLRRSTNGIPLPEYQWILADTLRAAGNEKEALDVEEEMRKTGAANDPRTYSIYLSTKRQSVDKALLLAQRELEVRDDIFTNDAVAWALHANGREEEASEFMEKALSEGTVDARLFLHAGIIASAAGRVDEGGEWLNKALAIQQMLFPSERDLLHQHFGDQKPLSDTVQASSVDSRLQNTTNRKQMITQ